MATIQKRFSQKTNTESYRVKIRIKGHLPVTKTFDRLTDARRWSAQTETEIRQGQYFKAAKAQKHTVAETIDRYISDYLPSNPKREEGLQAKLLWWKQQLGHYTLGDLSKSLIIEKRDIILKTPKTNGKARTPATVNRYMAVLSHVFSVATNEWEWVEGHPMKKISKLQEPRGRVRFLDNDERARLLDACQQSRSPHLYTVVMLALSTGARHGEIMGIKWSDVDFNRRVITLHHTKNGERRILPISDRILPLLQTQSDKRSHHSDYVFPSPRYDRPLDTRIAWDSAVEKAGIKNFRFHDLRHSAASYLAMNGATTSEIAEVLGHKTLAMVKRYAHLSELHVASVVERMNQKIFSYAPTPSILRSENSAG
ncbi:MAG: tyrosine-type recombinase/integrase [Rickettsiales bacterium]